MEGLFGAAAGSRLFDMDQLKFREDARQEQELASNTAYKAAMAKAANREADIKEAKLADEQRLARLSAEAAGTESPTTPAGQIAQLQRVSQALIRSGNPGEAAKLLSTSAQIVQRLESAAASKASAAKSQFDRAQQVMGALQQTVLGVKNQAELDQARLTWQAAYPDEPFPQELETFNPTAISRFVANSKAWLDGQKLQLDERNSASQRALRDARTTYMKGALADRQARTTIYKEASERKAAANGLVENRPVGSAPQTYVAMALTALKDSSLLVNDEEAQVQMARSIADDAWIVHQRNPAKSWATALEEAVQSSKDRGEIELNQPSLLGLTFNRNKFTPKVGSASRPLAEPAERDAELKPNTHYQRADGSIFLVKKGADGKLTAVPVARPGKPFGVAAPPPEVDNPLDDDEE
jgi:hypothetical protein